MNAQVFQRDLVQKTFTQLQEYNKNAIYTKPALDYYLLTQKWTQLTSGLSQEEVADLEKAKETLANYEKILDIVEYCSELNETMTALEKRIQTNNVSIPMNIYRKCPSNEMELLVVEMELFLKAYYNMMEDCKDYPLWRRKIEEDLGQSVSMLGVMLEEADRDVAVEESKEYSKFDSGKQVFFK